MESIIRGAPVSALTHQLRRVGRHAAPTAAAPAPPPVEPVAPPALDAAQLRAAQEARAEREQEQARQRRNAEHELAGVLADAERRGYAAGLERGAQVLQTHLQDQVDRFKSLGAQLAQAKTRVLEDAEDDLVELVFAATCRILGEGAATREAVLRMVRQRSPEARAPAAIRLHPEDLALLGQGQYGPEPNMTLRADPSIELGGCIVDSAAGTLDARLEVQLDRLRQTLLAVRSARKWTGEGA